MEMNIVILLVHLLMSKTCANIENDLIVDYFRYKEVSTVVGYTCNRIEDDVRLFKNFGDVGISVALSKLEVDSTVEKLAETYFQKLGVILDCSCHNNTESIIAILAEATDYRMFDELHSWLLIGYNLSDILQIVNDRAFGISTDFTVATLSDGEIDEYDLYDVYNAARNRGGKLNVTFFGKWNRREGMDVVSKQTKYQRRSNLNGMTFRVSFYKQLHKTNDVSLEDYLQDYSSAPKEGFSRFGYILMSHLSDLYNFKMESHGTPEWEAGDKYGPIVRSLTEGDFDMAGGLLALSVPRTYWIKFVHQSWPLRSCFIFRSPQPSNIKVNQILRPFADEIWYSLLVLSIANVIILTIVSRLDWPESNSARLSDSFIVNVGAMCQQSTNMSMEFMSTRIAFLALISFGLLIYNYYSAGVVSARLNEPIYKINDSLNQLRQLPLKMSSEKMIYLEFFLNQPNWDTEQFRKKKWLKIPESERFMEPELGIKMVKQGGFAYHLHPADGYPMIEKTFSNREICELMEVHLASPITTAFAVTMNSSIAEIARVGFTKISEVGLRYRQVKKWQYRKPECSKNILNVSSVTMDEFLPQLILLAIGTVVAALMCLIEISRVKYVNYRRSRVILITHERIVKRQIFDLRRLSSIGKGRNKRIIHE